MIPLRDLNPTRAPTYLTIALIVVNAIVFLTQILRPGLDQELVFFRHGVIPRCFLAQGNKEKHEAALREALTPMAQRWFKGSQRFRQRVAKELERQDVRITGPDDFARHAKEAAVTILRKDVGRRIEWLTLLTSMLMHGGWMHLIGNMWFLWIFGNNIEDACGRGRFLLFYVVCGALATGVHIATGPSSSVPTIGASGAISGVLGAYLLLFPRARVESLIPLGYFFWIEEVPAWVFLGVWILLQFLNGLPALSSPTTSGVAWFAHIGGFAAGMALIYLFRRRQAAPPGGIEFGPGF